MPKQTAVDIYVESGSKRVFAGAIEWPGWCRTGRDEVQAVQGLTDYAKRYAKVVGAAGAGLPGAAMNVVERVKGNATTDFGAPAIAPKADSRPVTGEDLKELLKRLQASWRTLDKAAAAAEGKPLATGPRGGGRDLDAIFTHVLNAETAYARKIGGQPPKYEEADSRAAAPAVRKSIVDALERAVEVGLPKAGPRGGQIWAVRYFVRRAAWHVLDHAWEIEDRAGS
jgi:hypothetical protein